MSHLFDRLTFFTRVSEPFARGHGARISEDRQWEQAYRNRWHSSKVIRSTHGVNCTGSCSWNIHVKEGLVAFEIQATDYPRTRPDMPNHEPRGCQRGASYSWYLYSPHRIKHPLIRGRLLDLYRAERAEGKDPVAAWAAIQADPDKRRRYTAVRGLGGFVRAGWAEVTEIIAAANVYTIQKYGPDRVVGFSPIPAMSMISFAAGTRYLSLIGATSLSFYDWYCDLPPSSPQTWGEQTDVPESADWWNSSYIIVAGTNIPMTRTPDAHFYSEARYNGTKVVAVSPDYSEYVKFADLWMPAKAGTDAALFLAMGHVVLKEFFIDREEPYFIDYARRFTDLPMLVMLRRLDGTRYAHDRFLRASDFNGALGESDNAEWKPVAWDEILREPVAPAGSIGHRWQKEPGQWNLKPVDGRERQIRLALSSHQPDAETVTVAFPEFSHGDARIVERQVPVRRISLGESGTALVATVFDLLVAHYGVDRTAAGTPPPALYDDPDHLYSPAWQEAITGVRRDDVIRTAREFAASAARTRGRAMVIVGAGTNHWYHNDMNYRSIINLVHLCGCVGQSGGGWAHYVGQEKLRPQAGWQPLAFASDWYRPARQMAGTSFFYLHTDQWRYEKLEADSLLSATASAAYRGHSLADYEVVAERMGWLPSAPHFNRNPLDLYRQAAAAGCTDSPAVARYLAEQLRSGSLRMAAEDIDAPENWPRNLFVWRANLIGSSAKGHEYFLKHLLGAQNAVLAPDEPGEASREITWRETAPVGKLDLMVDINFRLNSTGANADIVLPTATWYEKFDLNTTDMHPFIHPLTRAVDPGWDSKSDWQIFAAIAKAFSLLAERHLGRQTDVVATPLLHDTPTELGQALGPRDWRRGECEPIPGKTMPQITLVSRDYPRVHEQYGSLGPLLAELGNGTKGISWPTRPELDALAALNGVTAAGLPSIADDIAACETVLMLAPETNGEVAHRAWRALEERTGLALSHLADERRAEKLRFHDLIRQPRKIITSPTWSGIESEEVSYNASYINIHEGVPFRTLTGRAQFYLDHAWMLDFGEGFCLYRPPLDLQELRGVPSRYAAQPHLTLRWITPHSKWGIHSTYNDNLRMLNLFRGGPCVWLAEADAAQAGICDNDWVEALNVNGVTLARAVVSQRIPRGVAMMYHAQEKTINVPGSPTTAQRGGILNSVTRIVPKPTHMIGGYAQLSWLMNYYGPVGSQRDTTVMVRKVPDAEIRWLDAPLSAERERTPDAPPQARFRADGDRRGQSASDQTRSGRAPRPRE